MVVAYFVATDESVAEYVNLIIRGAWVQIQKYVLMARFHPFWYTNPVGKWWMMRKYRRIAKRNAGLRQIPNRETGMNIIEMNDGRELRPEEAIVELLQRVAILEAQQRRNEIELDYLRSITTPPDKYTQLNQPMKHPEHSRRVVTKQQLEKLIMDITQSDLNRQMQQLLAEYKRTGREEFKYNAEALMEEFDAWWDYESLTFEAPSTTLSIKKCVIVSLVC